jgi:hypothetical protein
MGDLKTERTGAEKLPIALMGGAQALLCSRATGTTVLFRILLANWDLNRGAHKDWITGDLTLMPNPNSNDLRSSCLVTELPPYERN